MAYRKNYATKFYGVYYKELVRGYYYYLQVRDVRERRQIQIRAPKWKRAVNHIPHLLSARNRLWYKKRIPYPETTTIRPLDALETITRKKSGLLETPFIRPMEDVSGNFQGYRLLIIPYNGVDHIDASRIVPHNRSHPDDCFDEAFWMLKELQREYNPVIHNYNELRRRELFRRADREYDRLLPSIRDVEDSDEIHPMIFPFDSELWDWAHSK